MSNSSDRLPPLNKTIKDVGLKSAVMTIVAFIGIYLSTRSIPSLTWLPAICIIPGIVYFSFTVFLKIKEKEFNIILKKQNGKCRDCRTPIYEMSDQTWVINGKIFCLKCGEKH